MSQLKTVMMTEAEAWIIDDLIRHTWTEEGQSIGRSLLLKVFSLLKEFEQRSLKPHPPRELPIALTEEECWAIDYHVRRGYVDPAGFRVGKELLLKIFDVLLQFANEQQVQQVHLAEGVLEEDEQIRARLAAYRQMLDLQSGDESERPRGQAGDDEAKDSGAANQ